MAEITNGFFDALNDPKAAMWSAGVAFNRSNPLPLDKWSVFETLLEAQTYAAGNAVAYPGQLIAVQDGGKMVAMVLTEGANGLVPEQIGIIPTGEGAVSVDANGKVSLGIDEATIEVVDGKLTLLNFAGAENGAQLVKQDGELVWVKPDSTTVDGLATKVAQLEAADVAIKADITALKNVVGEDGEEPTGLFADIAAAEGRLDTVEGDVEILEGAVGDLEELVGAPKEGEVEATGLYAEVEGLDTRIDALETKDLELVAALNGKANAADVYTKTEVYTVAEADNAIAVAVAGAAHLKRVKVASVDAINVGAADAEQYIYMVPAAEGDATQGDLYDEYMVLDGKVEKVGDWKVDLSGYATISSVNEISAQVNGIAGQLSSFAKAADVEEALGEVEEALAGKVDNETLEGYATTGALAGEVAKLATKGELAEANAAINSKVTAVAGKDLVDTAEIAKLATVAEGAEVNFVKSVDEEQLKVEEGKLSIIELDQALVAGLKNAAGADATLAAVLAEKAEKTQVAEVNAALAGKVNVPTDGSRFITTEEASKLEALVIGEGGKVEISGKVNASNVQELYNSVINIVTGTGKGTYDGAEKELLGVEKGAQVNTIEGIKINNVDVAVDSNKKVNIPQATALALGLVKSSGDENKVQVLADGTMEVNSLNVKKLVQDEALILAGGNAAGQYPEED